MSMETVQVALVDDHRLFRSGIAALIGNFKGYKVVFEASNGIELIEKIGFKTLPHIILLDINMPGMNGFQTTAWLKNNYPDIPVIILSMFSDAEKVLKMIKGGVKGYLLKDADPNEFKTAMDEVMRGKTYFPSFIAQMLVQNHFGMPRFTERELEFIRLVSTELTFKEIAEKMKISVRTVDGYRDQIFHRLQVKNRIGLVLYAIKNNLVEL